MRIRLTGTHIVNFQSGYQNWPEKYEVRLNSGRVVNHRTMGRERNMADDKMNNDDLQRNMGRTGNEGQDYDQQSPGRSGQGGGTRQSGQQGGQHDSQYGSGQNDKDMENDDDFATGGAGKTGGQNRGG